MAHSVFNRFSDVVLGRHSARERRATKRALVCEHQRLHQANLSMVDSHMRSKCSVREKLLVAPGPVAHVEALLLRLLSSVVRLLFCNKIWRNFGPAEPSPHDRDVCFLKSVGDCPLLEKSVHDAVQLAPPRRKIASFS